MTAKMGYDWSDKEADCFRLYVQEGKPIDEVIDWFRREKGFAPRYVLQSAVDGTIQMWMSLANESDHFRASAPCLRSS